jgi:hypothetical protein
MIWDFETLPCGAVEFFDCRTARVLFRLPRPFAFLSSVLLWRERLRRV